MSAFLKVIIRIIKATLVTVTVLTLSLGVAGGGWGAKEIPVTHPFYSGELRLIAHRGVSDKAPENTLAAASRARELGFTTVELDIKKSKDQKLFLFHDRESTRLFGQEFPLQEKTLAELQAIPLIHSDPSASHYVPDLETFTDRHGAELDFYLDFKRHGEYQYFDLASRIADFLEQYQLTDRTFVGSDFLFTAYLEFLFPEIHTVFTGPGDWTIIMYRCIPIKFRPDFIISYAREVTPTHIKWLQWQGLLSRRMLYGVNGANYQRVREWNLPILVVDYHPIMDQDLVK